KRGGEIQDAFALRGWPKKGEIPLACLQAVHDRPRRGIHHRLECNPDTPGKLLAHIEPHPLRLVRRGTANDGRRRPEIERYTELAVWCQGTSLFVTGCGSEARATCYQKPNCRRSKPGNRSHWVLLRCLRTAL